MAAFEHLEDFIHAHRPHSELTWWTTAPTPQAYRVVACPCGVTFERWVCPTTQRRIC